MHPDLNGVEQLQADQFGQAPQADHPAVGRLADPGCPVSEVRPGQRPCSHHIR